ncbi:MAG: sensor histidine kinase [Ktedonobacteraceae bacterium]
MASQIEIARIDRAAITKQFLYRATESAGYVTIVIGYIISILSASSLTFTNVLTFTGLQLLYTLVFWWSNTRASKHRWTTVVGVGALLLLTFANGMLVAIGIYFDWLLYFVTVAVFCTILSLPVALLLCLILFLGAGGTLFLMSNFRDFGQTWISLLAGFAFVAAFSLANKLLIAQRERTEILLRQLEEANHEREQANIQLQNYADEVEEMTVDRERTRMAREIHDTLGHYLTILSIQLETISKLQERDPARAMIEVAEAQRVAAQSMQEVRNAVAALRPSSIATLSLPEALTQLANEFRNTANEAELTLDLETQFPSLSPEVQLALYRVVQEALTNIHKHTYATKILIRLRYEEGEIELVVLDNGSGEKPKQLGSGFGLVGLRERIELLSGHVTYGPEEPSGYRVAIRVPVSYIHQTENGGEEVWHSASVS